MHVLECRPESVKSIQSAQPAVPVHKLQNGSRQSSKTGSETRLHIAAITVGHKTGLGSTLMYLKAKNHTWDTLIHCAEALGHPYTC